MFGKEEIESLKKKVEYLEDRTQTLAKENIIILQRLGNLEKLNLPKELNNK